MALPEEQEQAADESTATPEEQAADESTATSEEQAAGETVAASEVQAAGESAATAEERSPEESIATPEEPPGRVILGRRRLLLAGAGLAAAAVAGGLGVAMAGDDRNDSGSPSPPSAPATTKPREPESTHLATPPITVQRTPIHTLADYRKATGAAPFPADAIALTIDDGPHPVWTPKILRLLDKHHVPALFCMIGNQVLGHEDVATMVTAAGHQLANHTWSHPTLLDKKAGDVVHREILRAQKKIQKTTGHVPRIFRSPGGAWSPTVLQQVAAAGLLPLDWTNDPKDWTQPGAAKIEHTMLAARPGQILLCHDGGGDRSQTYHALKVVIPRLKARGLRFVAL